MPLAIIIALLVVTTMYILVTIVAVATQPWEDFEGQEAGLSQILMDITGSTWPGTFIAAGAVISIFSVTLVAGGGVRGAEDLRKLADAGCQGALMASALQDGHLSATDVAAAIALQPSVSR